MGKELLSKEIFKTTFEEASDILRYDLASACQRLSEDELSSMSISQPAIFVFGIASYRYFVESTGLRPAFLLGHSLGEYAALAAMDAISFKDGVEMIKVRGELLEREGKRHNGQMLAVSGAEVSMTEDICNACVKHGMEVYLAVVNASNQHVIAGTPAGVTMASSMLESVGATTRKLTIFTASHCPLLKDAVDEMRECLNACEFRTPSIPVISNVTAMPHADGKAIPSLLAEHMVTQVKWHQSMQFLCNSDVNVIVEGGPQAMLKKIGLSSIDQCYSMDVEEDRGVVKQQLPMEAFRDIVRLNMAAIAAIPNSNNSVDYSPAIGTTWDSLIEAKGRQSVGDNRSIRQTIDTMETILNCKKAGAKERSIWSAKRERLDSFWLEGKKEMNT
ncbi:MAG: ACP S-malonyltransferase [Cytophagales bacterium]|nr:ACP S-malonyltransferase [Cytophagales bacterium]